MARTGKRAGNREERLHRVLESGRRLGAAEVRFHSTVAEHLGLGAVEIKTLDALRTDGPLTPKDLGVRMGLAPASITGMVDRLAAKGYVVRRPHPEDGRRVLVEMAPDAEVTIRPLFDDLLAALTEVLDRRNDDELELMAELLAEQAACLERVVDSHSS